jgi:hypothetical protein
LVINLPREQIIDEDDFLAQNQVLLLTQEDIDLALSRVDLPPNLDTVFDQARERMLMRKNISVTPYSMDLPCM